MSWLIWPLRWLRSNNSPARRPRTYKPTVEFLEERAVPALTPYQSWQQQTFTVDDLRVANLAADPGIQANVVPQNASFGDMIGLPSVFSNYPYRGTGYSVAVIDTGIDYNHVNLGGGFGAGFRVIAGWDFVNNDANPMDDNGHGTHIAGIIGSSNATYSGVAPNVNLIALKVLSAAGSGTFGAVESALQWVVANQSKYNIVAINLSLGAGNYTTNPYTFLEDEFDALKSQGVFSAVAAGNSFYASAAPGLDYPAISPNVVSVGAVWGGDFGPIAWGSGARDFTTAADRITSFSQRSNALSIMAPGAMITSTYLNNTHQAMAGTSMAAPVVAGAAAMLHQALDTQGLTANQTTILGLLKQTGVTVVDGDDENDNVNNTGLSFKRLNLAAALDATSEPTNAAPALQAIANQSVAPGATRVVTLNASDAEGDLITFTAQIDGNTGATSASLAYQLRQQLGLTFNGDYFLNTWGQNEKWLTSTSGTWYCIMPNGDLRRWAGAMSATLLPENFIAALGANFYADPSLLWNASPSAAPNVTVVGNLLTIQTDVGSSGSYTITATASDGVLSSTQTFTLTIQDNTGPQIPAIANQALAAGTSRTITLAGADAENDPLTYSATIVGAFASAPANLGVVGNQLTIQAAAGFTGDFDVCVTVSDGSLSAETTIHVQVAIPVTSVYHFNGDFDGNGTPDRGDYFADGSIWVNLGSVPRRWATWNGATAWNGIYTGDANRDGKADLIGFSKQGTVWVGLSTGTSLFAKNWAVLADASNWRLLQVGEFNGDGRTDIGGFTKTGRVVVGLSTGTTFTVSTWSNWGAASGWATLTFTDFNSDGKLDLVGKNNLGKWYIGYSTGKTFTLKAWGSSTPPI